jgi:hypothetical protein
MKISGPKLNHSGTLEKSRSNDLYKTRFEDEDGCCFSAEEYGAPWQQKKLKPFEHPFSRRTRCQTQSEKEQKAARPLADRSNREQSAWNDTRDPWPLRRFNKECASHMLTIRPLFT